MDGGGDRGGVDRHHSVCGFPVPLMMRKASEGVTDRYSIGRLLSPRDEGIDCDESTRLPRWPKRSVFFMPIPDAMKGERSPSFPWRSTASDQRIWHKRHPGTASKRAIAHLLTGPATGVVGSGISGRCLAGGGFWHQFSGKPQWGNGGVQS